MCSIMGFTSDGLSPEEFQPFFDRTVSRGPDMSRVERAGKGWLCFHRLAIMGLHEEGMQPFHLDGDMCVCNGELYLFRTLKKELEDEGYRFRSGSDCELILPLYRKYGTGMFALLDAEFAMVIYDGAADRFIAARDPIGIRPLFYGCLADGGVVIASEAKNLVGLCDRVLPYLASLPHEVYCINTVSLIHKAAGRIDYGDFWFEKHYSNVAVYARSKLCLAKYTWALAVMNHPGIAVTPLGLNAYGFPDSRAVRFFRRFFNSPEKSSLSVAWILSHDPEPGSVTGPKKFFGGWGYPEKNRVSKKVKTGAGELIRFTDAEIAKAHHPEG